MTPFWRKREDPEQRLLADRLATLPLFEGLSREALIALAARLHWLPLRAGEQLFDQGDPADALYLVIYGRLGAFRKSFNDQWKPVGSIVSGHAVGELGLLADQPRNARVIALRDCELLRLDRHDFEQLLAEHPQPMLRMARSALKRYSSDQVPPPLPRCFALLPATRGVDVEAFAQRFLIALGKPENSLVIRAEDCAAADQSIGGFADREQNAAYLLYLGNEDAQWRERCARQSDVVMLLADANGSARHSQRLPVPAGHERVPQLLLLQRNCAVPAGNTREWLSLFDGSSEAVHLCDQADLSRLGRRLSGRATGLVLSGGGARGFAHLGALRGLRESGYQIDYIGGSSIGAIMGAGVAAGWDDDALHEINYRSFVLGKPVSDWTLPLVSLYSGRRVARLLREAFGERDIEDLPRRFFCVSSNLTTGQLMVHEQGRLWHWLRASSAIPGILPPVLTGGNVLVDGGVIDNLPVREMRQRMSGRIVAIDAGDASAMHTQLEEFELPRWWKLLPGLIGRGKRPRITQILLRAGMVNSDATTRRWGHYANLMLRPELPSVDLLDWKGFNRAYDAGYRSAIQALEAQARSSPDDDLPPA